MCIKENYNTVLASQNEKKINAFMDDCYDCVKYGSCDYYANLDLQLRILDGQAGKCIFCGEINNFEDMAEGNTGWYCDHCRRGIESRC